MASIIGWKMGVALRQRRGTLSGTRPKCSANVSIEGVRTKRDADVLLEST
jgi:hypothetical protein